MTAKTDRRVVELASPLDFAATLARLTGAIEAAGMIVFVKLDHANAAHEAKLVMPPTVVLIYGHARGGTPIMLAAPIAALDLPLHVLVRADAVGTKVAFHPIARVLREAGVPDGLVNRLDSAQHLVEEALRP